jgi:uncharacterized protein with GYD domain
MARDSLLHIARIGGSVRRNRAAQPTFQEAFMPHYLVQVAYTPDAWSHMVKNPVNRTEQIRPMVERLGGKIVGAYMTFGEYDTVSIIELPANTDAAAFAIVASAGGSVRSIKTTPLLTSEEALEALKKAPGIGYKAVGA